MQFLRCDGQADNGARQRMWRDMKHGPDKASMTAGAAWCIARDQVDDVRIAGMRSVGAKVKQTGFVPWRAGEDAIVGGNVHARIEDAERLAGTGRFTRTPGAMQAGSSQKMAAAMMRRTRHIESRHALAAVRRPWKSDGPGHSQCANKNTCLPASHLHHPS